MAVLAKTARLAKGAWAGLLGGLAASFVMNHFMSGIALATAGSTPPGSDPQRTKQMMISRRRCFQELADPTGEVSESIARRVFHRSLSPSERDIAAPAVHYAFGALMGAVYGALAESFPEVRAGKGALFSTALWLAGDEIAVPALGLTRPPWQQPAKAHAAMFASHVVYGVALETVRKQVREAA